MPEERLATPISAAAAVERIAPGSRVYVAAKGGTPVALLDALARRGTPDIELFYFLLDGISASALVTRAPPHCKITLDSLSFIIHLNHAWRPRNALKPVPEYCTDVTLMISK